MIKLTGDGRFWGGVVLAVIGAAAYVILAFSNNELEAARGVLVFLTPFILALIAAPVVDSFKKDLDRNTATTQQVQRQTNGALTAHIDKVAEKAVTKTLAATFPTYDPESSYGKDTDNG